mmetsp:Transcript_10880/g.20139  ORF Transcript_10880/g.20139 Transcript_10880/m.20139 type:complete len:81 (+) Transcript_10880:193-435(+)
MQAGINASSRFLGLGCRAPGSNYLIGWPVNSFVQKPPRERDLELTAEESSSDRAPVKGPVNNYSRAKAVRLQGYSEKTRL